MKTKELVQKARENGGFRSLAALGKAIGVNQSSLSLLAAGKSELSDEVYAKLAELAGADPAEVLIEKHREKAAGPHAKAAWDKIAQKMTQTAAVCAGVGLLVTLDQHVTAGHFSHWAVLAFTNIYYAKYSRRRTDPKVWQRKLPRQVDTVVEDAEPMPDHALEGMARASTPPGVAVRWRGGVGCGGPRRVTSGWRSSTPEALAERLTKAIQTGYTCEARRPRQREPRRPRQ